MTIMTMATASDFPFLSTAILSVSSLSLGSFSEWTLTLACVTTLDTFVVTPLSSENVLVMSSCFVARRTQSIMTRHFHRMVKPLVTYASRLEEMKVFEVFKRDLNTKHKRAQVCCESFDRGVHHRLTALGSL